MIGTAGASRLGPSTRRAQPAQAMRPGAGPPGPASRVAPDYFLTGRLIIAPHYFLPEPPPRQQQKTPAVA